MFVTFLIGCASAVFVLGVLAGALAAYEYFY